MGFGQSVRTCLAKFATFSGRASRAEYWYFFLFLVIVNVITGVIDWMFFTTVTSVTAGNVTVVTAVSSKPVQGLAGLVLFLPHLAVAWRRMHDTGRSGLYALLPLLLIAGALAVLVFGIGIADLFASGGRLDLLFTGLTLLAVLGTLAVLFISPLLVIWWLSRPSQPGENRYGPNPHEVTT